MAVIVVKMVVSLLFLLNILSLANATVESVSVGEKLYAKYLTRGDCWEDVMT
jgi:hypothetical protein